MEVEFAPDLERRLSDLAHQSGRNAGELVQDVVAGYVEVAGVRGLLDARYDDLKSGRVEPIDGEQFFEHLRQRGKALGR
jgi:hypothetical protein